MYCAPLVGVLAHRAILQVFLDQQHLRPAALESHDPPRAKLPAVQPNIIRPHARRKPALVEKLAPPLVNLQPQLPLLRIPIKVEIPRQLLRPRRLLFNRCRLPRFRTRSRCFLPHRRRLSRFGPPPCRPASAPAINKTPIQAFAISHAPNLPNGFTSETEA